MGTLIVSIGRNVGDEPMDDSQWVTFQEEAHRWTDQSVWSVGGQIVFEGVGVGQWTDEDGHTVREDAFTIVALVDDEVGDTVADEIVNRMAITARNYGQDAIAVTLGATTLAGMQQSASN
jgi:hypothetical protein